MSNLPKKPIGLMSLMVMQFSTLGPDECGAVACAVRLLLTGQGSV